MRILLRVIQGALVVGLAISTSCSRPADEPHASSQQSLDDTSWYFWAYHANFPYAFYGNCPSGSNSCTNGCDYSNQGQQVYTNGPFNGYDLDWSHGSWVGGAAIRLPVDAQYVDYSNLTVACTNGGGTGTEWIPRFQALDSNGNPTGQAFLFNHLRHSSNSGNGLITPGTKYNAGALVGYEGGYACNEGNGIWTNPSNGAQIRISDGDHGCMVTAPPAAPCSFLTPGYVPTSSCKYSNGSDTNPISACNCTSSNSVAGWCAYYSNLAGMPVCGPNYTDNCGKTIDCGSCGGGQICSSGVCQTCSPPACGPGQCGTLTSSCGASANCGGCQSGYACANNSCIPVPTCPSGTCNTSNATGWCGPGYYCGSSGLGNAAPNTLYYCGSAGAAATSPRACGEECHFRPNNNDACWEDTSTCSAWSPYNVNACGWDSVNGNPRINYHCYYGSKSIYQWCSPGRCAWGSVNDYCY